jgi:hypothetical protein
MAGRAVDHVATLLLDSPQSGDSYHRNLDVRTAPFFQATEPAVTLRPLSLTSSS